ncbi:hypothetical protein CR513_10550, partial [Mucuna pruriens]
MDNMQGKSIKGQRGDETFQVLGRINDYAYKLDLSIAYGNVSSTFNVANLSLFFVSEEFDSRMNPFEEGGELRSKRKIKTETK